MSQTNSDSAQRVALVGCGYVGLALGKTLHAAGCSVVGTTTSDARVAEIEAAGLSVRLLDVADADCLAEIVRDRDVVYLTVAAGRGGQAYRDVYLRAAENLVRALPGSSVARVIYTSSTSVYAQRDGSWVDETSPAGADSENGKVLLATERTLLDAGVENEQGREVQISVVRLAGIYGPGREPARFAARFAGQERDDGEVYLNLVHLDDIVAALARLRTIPHHGVLNLADDTPTTRRVVFDPILRAANLPPVRWTAGASGDRGKRIANGRIKALLDLTLRHPGFVAEADS
ncbi:MAG: SDR family oxidoreductase [Phycisphaerales bacterium]|nr:SDR family oxidoreductase [Phycisphaerales bacterium]